MTSPIAPKFMYLGLSAPKNSPCRMPAGNTTKKQIKENKKTKHATWMKNRCASHKFVNGFCCLKLILITLV